MNSKDFLHNDLFIYWRIHPTKELDAYWENFLKENDGVREQFYEAITDFEKIRHVQNSFIEEEFSVKKKLYTQIENHRKKNQDGYILLQPLQYYCYLLRQSFL